MVTDLDDDDNADSVHKFFDACLGEGAVRRVCTITDLDENVVEPREDDEKDHDAGDWPEAGDFTGGKHDRHASADDFQA